uniref:Uncharacterized protein n=1 Tax=Rhizophora mucronata TaxID=61149 RepID=A0A2P2NBL9_RHIMU
MQMILKQPICLKKLHFHMVFCPIQIRDASMTQLGLRVWH